MYKYDVALSYESGSQDYVWEVAEFLKTDGNEVFFAPDRKQQLLSENLKKELYRIYQKESLVKVLFVTEAYLKSEYTMLEARRSQCSAGDDPRRLIVINFMGERLPKELKPFVYLEGTDFPDNAAFFISSRIEELKRRHDREEHNREEYVWGKREKERKVEIKIENSNTVRGNKGIVVTGHGKINNAVINR